MKANEAPEKIYLQVCGDCPQTDCENCKFEDLEDNVTWCKDRIFPEDIEYIRKDAFIEKACSWLSNMSIEDMEYKYDNFDTSEGLYRMIEDFKKYMEE